MAYLKGENRNQITLFLEAVYDYIAEANPVRVIETILTHWICKSLDLKERAQKYRRPPYDFTDLLKLYLYGYLNRIRSSRRLETEANPNLEL